MRQSPRRIFPNQIPINSSRYLGCRWGTGAVIAQALIGPLSNIGGTSKRLIHAMEIFAAFMVCGVFTTLLISEIKRRTLEERAKTYNDDDEGDGEGNDGQDGSIESGSNGNKLCVAPSN